MAQMGKRVLAILMGICLSLLIMEVVLRVYNPFEFRLRGNRIVLQTNKKHVIENSVAPKLDKEIVQVSNSLGFRGEEPPQQFDEKGVIPLVFDQYLTIIAVGGSTTECFYLSEGKTWEDRLSALLKERFARVWVNNAGLGGHSTFGHQVLLRDYVVNLRPDIVLFLLGFNDVGRAVPAANADRKLMEGGKFRGDDNDATAQTSEDVGEGLCFSSWRCFGASLAYYSELANLTLNIYRNFKAADAAAGQLGQVMVKQVSRGVALDVQLDLTKFEHVATRQTEIDAALQEHRQNFLAGYAERVRNLVEVSRQNGIEPVLMTQPALYGSGKDEITGVDLETIRLEDGKSGLLTWKVLELYNDVIRKVAEDEGVLLIDLAHELPKSSAYYYDLGHYTNEGAQKVAEIIEEALFPFILEKGMAEPLRK